jgi:hypothetical protein
MSRPPPKIKQYINGQPVLGQDVQPIKREGVAYSIDSQHCLNDARKITGTDWTLTATDVDAKILWKVVYYHNEFNLDVETDVQNSYPIDFKIVEEEIVIEHEHGIIFHVSFDGILLEGKKPE